LKQADTLGNGKISTNLTTVQQLKEVVKKLFSLLLSLERLGRVAKSFKLFPNLPPELRIKIWRMAAPEPGILSVKEGPGFSTQEGQIILPSTRKLPAMLMVNAEARYEALKVFRPFFEPQLNKALYFDEEHDTLYFEKESAMELFFTRARGLQRRSYCERIKYVAFGSTSIRHPITGAFESDIRPYSLFAMVLWQLPYVREATIILDDEEATHLNPLGKANMVMDTYISLNRYFSLNVRRYSDRKPPKVFAYTMDELKARIASGRALK
jgi:hypothetical protein